MSETSEYAQRAVARAQALVYSRGEHEYIPIRRLWDILIPERTTMSKAHTQLEKGLLSSQHPGLFCPTPHKGTTSALRARGPAGREPRRRPAGSLPYACSRAPWCTHGGHRDAYAATPQVRPASATRLDRRWTAVPRSR